MQPPNPLKRTQVPGPNQEARSPPGGRGAVLERVLGSFVQQPVGTKLGAAVPPSRNASCAQLSWVDTPVLGPPPSRAFLHRGSRLLHLDWIQTQPTSPPRSRPVPLPRPDPPIAEQLTCGARPDPRLEKSLLATFLPAPQTAVEEFWDGCLLQAAARTSQAINELEYTHNMGVLDNMGYLK